MNPTRLISLLIATIVGAYACVKEDDTVKVIIPPPTEDSSSTDEEEPDSFDVPDPETFTMPRVYLTHGSGTISKDYALEGTFSVQDADRHYSDIAEFSCGMTIQGRGNTTWGMEKKPYKIRLEEKSSLLGMPANKDWILLANYSDKSLLRNAVALKTSEMVGMPWTPRYRNVEVYLNSNYIGVYNLIESKEVAKHKVDIDLEAGDIYLEIESTQDGHEYFCTSRYGVPIQFQEPKSPSQDQIKTVKDQFRKFEDALYGDNFRDSEEGYAKYIDVDSFINFYIIEELAKDIDGNTRKSSFLSYSPSTGKIAFYHVWDFDICYGNADYFPGDMAGCIGDVNGPTGWWIRDFGPACRKNSGWYYRLFQDPRFLRKVQKRWAEVYPTLGLMDGYIDYWVAEMGDAPDRNFARWDILRRKVWPNVAVPGTYSGEISYLKDFYDERLEWINTELQKIKLL